MIINDMCFLASELIQTLTTYVYRINEYVYLSVF